MFDTSSGQPHVQTLATWPISTPLADPYVTDPIQCWSRSHLTIVGYTKYHAVGCQLKERKLTSQSP